LCLLITNLKVIREFGLYAAIAMLLALVTNLILVPIWLSYLKEEASKAARQKQYNPILQRVMHWAAGINQKHVKVNILLALIVFMVSFTGIVRIETKEKAYDLAYQDIENAKLLLSDDLIAAAQGK